jgi:hypothetical protein
MRAPERIRSELDERSATKHPWGALVGADIIRPFALFK